MAEIYYLEYIARVRNYPAVLRFGDGTLRYYNIVNMRVYILLLPNYIMFANRFIIKFFILILILKHFLRPVKGVNYFLQLHNVVRFKSNFV